ncbi:MAG: isoprenylcysteine carboxylmethyltransferase family protein [Ardenticatenales bacterium]|nr:isoprenylcysteine carboxylmethyltransferase family protein [Ardenticatenales bacterium]
MGERGEGWVVLQFILLLVIALAPVDGQLTEMAILRPLGYVLMVIGGLIGLFSARNLGRNLTALPKPVEQGKLVQDGLYGLVRHPIYLGLLLAALGWALWRRSAIGIALSLLLFVFFDAKARREERWLTEKYPDDYPDYQKRVKKLIPWIY